jgi:uncharacterized protein (DUF2237 family)
MNVLEKKLKLCGSNPLTGYDRNGYCNVNMDDIGTHLVCAIVTQDFLNFTYSKGNDLINPTNGFPGLKPGDRWCLCVFRWIEAYNNGFAPYIDLERTPYVVKEKYIPLHILFQYDYRNYRQNLNKNYPFSK